jgi:hypothetical protein
MKKSCEKGISQQSMHLCLFLFFNEFQRQGILRDDQSLLDECRYQHIEQRGKRDDLKGQQDRILDERLGCAGV